MTNPLKAYIEKKAAFGQEFGSALRKGFGGESIGKAVAGAGLAGGVGLAGLAAQRVVDAMTKANDFKQMLAYDASLAQMHEEDPRLVNQMFSTLRTFNPAFTRDPVVASSYVRRMVEGAPTGQSATLAVEALEHQTRPAVPLGQMMLGKAMGGGGKKK